MDGLNMESDFNVGRMTLQNILQNRDLSHPIQVNPAGKDDKDFADICPDASAAFLGPNIWEDYKTAFIDIDSFLDGSENVHRTLENLEPNVNQSGHHAPMHTSEVSNMHVQDMPAPPQCPSPTDSSSMQSYSESNEESRRSFTVDCKFSPSDLALATPPGHEHYDPTSRAFPEDELKPQPIIKKSRKNFVPDNLKDDKYWARRHKNNIAAKRSREARRLKENQIVLRASYLEKENNTLKEDVIRLQAENDMLKEKIRKYEL